MSTKFNKTDEPINANDENVEITADGSVELIDVDGQESVKLMSAEPDGSIIIND